MKKTVLFSVLFFTIISNAQKANTLLWEISGNGLAKNSYLYGTMHVNEKISYHLSDAFFKNLLAADIVSNESDPETWSEIPSVNADNFNASDVSYSEFYLNSPKRNDFKRIFFNNYYLNNMVATTNEQQADFQENTVLDMFIYQTGRKYKKKIVGLENAKKSMVSLYKMMDDTGPKPENQQLLQKLLKNRNRLTFTNDLYREKDIVMLDSVYKLMFSKKAHDLLIVDRNQIMVKSIDSLVKTGSLFAAVGAAHLAGKLGILQLLRDKGYTVSPIIDTFSDAGQKQKKTIEEYFPSPTLTLSGTQDGMIKMPLNKNILKRNEDLSSPDMTNGAVINIRRIPLNQFLNTKEPFDTKSLDSLFFENIAGDIIEKKSIQQESFSGFDIKNKTRTGNAQHNRFYLTPLELIAVSMSGTGNYVRLYENAVFDKIQVKGFKNTWETITPEKGGFSVEVPYFNTVYGNDPEKNQTEVHIEAYDNTEKSYYFVTEKNITSTSLLEDTAYEHKQIHFEFYQKQELDSTDTKCNKINESFESAAVGKKKIRLKSVIKGSKYYLLGAVDASESNVKKFFNSFTTLDFSYKSTTKAYSDTTAHFKIDIPEKQNEMLFLGLNHDRNTDKNTFTSKSKLYRFNASSGKIVFLSYYKYNKYESSQNLDSIQSDFRKIVLKNYENYDPSDIAITEDFEEEGESNSGTASLQDYQMYKKKGFSASLWNTIMADKKNQYEIKTESTHFDKPNNIYTFDATVSKPNTTQALKYRIVFTGDSYYMLNTLIEKDYKNDDPFLETAFRSFAPTQKAQTSVFDDKTDIFITDAMSAKDTIRFSALQSIDQLHFTKNDFDKIQSFIKKFNFKDSETGAISSLVEKIGEIENEDGVTPFLKSLYRSENIKTSVQFSILKALSSQKSKAAYHAITELLEYDLPLSDNTYEISSLFNNFENDLEHSKELFPKIFQFYSIDEYSNPVINFCNLLLEQKLVSSKKINSYRKIIFTNAKLECKRLLSWKEKQMENNDEETGLTALNSYNDAPTKNLTNYLDLIYSFPESKESEDFKKKIIAADIPVLDIELARLGIVNDQYSDNEIQKALENQKSTFATIALLWNKNKKELVAKMTDDEIAKAAVLNFRNITEKDSLALLEKRVIANNGKQLTYYFYKITDSSEKDADPKKRIYAIAFVNDGNRINPMAYKTIGFDYFEEESELPKKLETLINSDLNADHQRASYPQSSDAPSEVFGEY